jgi:vitamin B12 transporter
MILFVLLLAANVATAAPSGRGAAEGSGTHIFSDMIVVTAERIEQPWRESTAAITVLTREDLARLPAHTLADVLRGVPGMQVISVNPGAPPMLSSRGFQGAGEVEYVQLLIDGAPAGDVESGLADWRAIPVESIERIEIVRGAGSSLFGDTALGGVVQVFRRPVTHVSATIGSFGTTRWSAGFANASVSQIRSDGFRAHSASDERFANVTFGGFTLDASTRDREDPGVQGADGIDSDLFREDREESRRLRAAYRYHGKFDALFHAHDRHTDQTRTILLAPGFGDRATRDLDTSGAGANATKMLTLARGRVIGGIDLARETLRSRYDEIRGSGSRSVGAAFVSGEWRITPRVRAAAGARWDSIADSFESHDVTDRAFSPRIGMSIDAGPVTAYVQLSRAFKAPTLDQRFDQRPIAGFTISNPALSAQHAKNLEAGVRGENWEAIGYAVDVDDEIDFDVRTFRYANIGRSRHRGLETSYRGRYVSAGYTWTRVEGEDGHQLKNIAEHVIRVGFDVGTHIHLGIEHSANRWLDDANQFPLGDATLVDLRVAKTFGSLTAAVEANNLLDRHYAPLGFTLGDTPYYYPAAGRSIAFTISVESKPGGLRARRSTSK